MKQGALNKSTKIVIYFRVYSVAFYKKKITNQREHKRKIFDFLVCLVWGPHLFMLRVTPGSALRNYFWGIRGII